MEEAFQKQLRLHTGSGTGVLFVRTRDVMNTATQISIYAQASKVPFLLWDFARGWVVDQDPIDGNGGGAPDVLSAMTTILEGSKEEPQKFPDAGYYCMLYPQALIKEKDMNARVLQQLILMAHRFPNSRKRFILLMPPHVGLPPELQELVPVINDLPPDVPTLQQATDVFMASRRAKKGKILIPEYTTEDLKRIAQAGMGMIMPEFEGAMARASKELEDRQVPATPEVLRRAVLSEKAEMVKRSRSLEVMESLDVSQVGGLERLKAWLQTRVRAMDPDSWEMGVDKPKGCALVGPPGSGKSLCGKVIGSVLGVATIRFDISSVFSGLVGSSEENMRSALFMLESLAPAVVLLDEVDKALSVNSGGDGGTSQKVLGSLLTFMQETKAPIFWVPTLNRTENVPAEFLRAGRLDNVFGVSVPNQAERLEILKIHLRKRKVDPDTVDGLEDIVRATDKYVGAELESIVAGARLLAYNEDSQVELHHLTESMKDVRPLSRRMKAQFDAMAEWCKENATPSSEEFIAPEAVIGARKRSRAIN